MTKTLILPAFSSSESASFMPVSFVADLSPRLVNRILKLADAASDLDVFCIETFSNAGDWSRMLMEETRDAVKAMDPEAIRDQAVAVSSPMLRVTRSGFQFVANPDFGDRSIQLHTAMVDLDDLEDLNSDSPVITSVTD